MCIYIYIYNSLPPRRKQRGGLKKWKGGIEKWGCDIPETTCSKREACEDNYRLLISASK